MEDIVMGKRLDLAREFLSSLALDEDTLAYLRNGLDAYLEDFDGNELKDCLEPFLAADHVDRVLNLLLVSSQCCVGSSSTSSSVLGSSLHNANEVKGKQNDEDDALRSSICDALAQEDEKVKLETKEEMVWREIAPTTHHVSWTDASQFDEEDIFDEANCLETEGFDLDAAETCFQKARSIRTGHHVMIKNQPCRVVKIGTSKVWKGPYRGCFQTQIVAKNIFTGMRSEHLCPATEDVSIAVVKRQEYTVLDIGMDGELSLLTPTFDVKADVNLPTGTDDDCKLAECIKTNFHGGQTVVVAVLSSCGVEKVVHSKCTD